ncbi:NmrA-like family-domain-containing protein [Xylariaceae sp. FL1272]|nr:NmrA-like family-domain-containing protein [Xylariaceae sp. FL1272]
MTKLLTVFGATGQQGGAIIDYVLATPSLSSTFFLRGITRDASKKSAIALKDRGVEVIEADLNDTSTLTRAVDGSQVVFAVTNFWDDPKEGKEIAQGKAIADAAVAAGVHQIIWSSLPNASEITKGEVTGMKHFDGKAEVEAYIRTLDIKSAFVLLGWYMQNHLSLVVPKKNEDGSHTLNMPWGPEVRLPLIDIRDTGKFITPALLEPERYHQRRFMCATAFYSLREMADAWTEVAGKEVKLNDPSDLSQFVGLSQEQKRETVHTRKFGEYGYFGPDGDAELAWTIDQVPKPLGTWEGFLREYWPWVL